MEVLSLICQRRGIDQCFCGTDSRSESTSHVPSAVQKETAAIANLGEDALADHAAVFT